MIKNWLEDLFNKQIDLNNPQYLTLESFGVVNNKRQDFKLKIFQINDYTTHFYLFLIYPNGDEKSLIRDVSGDLYKFKEKVLDFDEKK